MYISSVDTHYFYIMFMYFFTLRKLAATSVAMKAPEKKIVVLSIGHSSKTAELHNTHLNKMFAMKDTPDVLRKI